MELKRCCFSIVLGVILCLFLSLFILTNSEAKPRPSPCGGGYAELSSDTDFLSTVKPWLPEEEFKNHLTVEAWIYIDSIPDEGTYWTLIGQEDRFEIWESHAWGGGDDFGAKVNEDRVGPPCMWMFPGIPTNKWTHFIVWYSPSVSFGIDGMGLPGVPSNAPIHTSLKPLRIGGTIPQGKYGCTTDGENTFFRGYIDEVRISSIIRYKQALVGGVPGYEVPKARLTPDKDTLCLWHFDEEPTAHRHDDVSGNDWFLWKNEVIAVQSQGKLCALWGKLKNE